MYFMRWSLFFLPLSLWSMWIGNPAQPGMQTQGIVLQSEWCSLRLGYLNDWVYHQDFRLNEFELGAEEHIDNTVQLATHAGLATFNFRDWIDLYAILGGSQLQVNEEIFTKPYFSWGVGGKILFFHMGNVRAGADMKYFQTDQTPDYFLAGGQAYNVLLPVVLAYSEIQAALGLSYETSWFSPYADLTYLISQLDAQPPKKAYVRFPQPGARDDVPVQASSGAKRWGMALGATILDKKTGSLALEWRLFNQNALDVNAEIRF